MKKKLLILAAVLCLAAGAFQAKIYYNNRYVVSDHYYTQIPPGEENTEDSWLVDADGVKQAKGKEYCLTGYNDRGEARELQFTQSGGAGDYYAPGTYLEADTSETLVLGIKTVEEAQVPAAAREKLLDQGARLP